MKKRNTVSPNNEFAEWHNLFCESLRFTAVVNLSAWDSPPETQNSFTCHRKTVTSYSVNRRLSLNGCVICLRIFCLITKTTTKPCELVPISKKQIYWHHCHTLWCPCTGIHFLAHICKFTGSNLYLIGNIEYKPKDIYFACSFTWIRGKDEVMCKDDVEDKRLTSGLSSCLSTVINKGMCPVKEKQ